MPSIFKNNSPSDSLNPNYALTVAQDASPSMYLSPKTSASQPEFFDKAQTFKLLELPAELISRIFTFVPTKDISSLRATHFLFYPLTFSSDVWKKRGAGLVSQSKTSYSNSNKIEKVHTKLAKHYVDLRSNSSCLLKMKETVLNLLNEIQPTPLEQEYKHASQISKKLFQKLYLTTELACFGGGFITTSCTTVDGLCFTGSSEGVLTAYQTNPLAPITAFQTGFDRAIQKIAFANGLLYLAVVTQDLPQTFAKTMESAVNEIQLWDWKTRSLLCTLPFSKCILQMESNGHYVCALTDTHHLYIWEKDKERVCIENVQSFCLKKTQAYVLMKSPSRCLRIFQLNGKKSLIEEINKELFHNPISYISTCPGIDNSELDSIRLRMLDKKILFEGVKNPICFTKIKKGLPSSTLSFSETITTETNFQQYGNQLFILKPLGFNLSKNKDFTIFNTETHKFSYIKKHPILPLPGQSLIDGTKNFDLQFSANSLSILREPSAPLPDIIYPTTMTYCDFNITSNRVWTSIKKINLIGEGSFLSYGLTFVAFSTCIKTCVAITGVFFLFISLIITPLTPGVITYTIVYINSLAGITNFNEQDVNNIWQITKLAITILCIPSLYFFHSFYFVRSFYQNRLAEYRQWRIDSINKKFNAEKMKVKELANPQHKIYFNSLICPLTKNPIRFPVEIRQPGQKKGEGMYYERAYIKEYVATFGMQPETQAPIHLNQLQLDEQKHARIERRLQEVQSILSVFA